ncbi:hypothetical protein SI65_02689 [Aspergillus cristatus]|uniref:Uncharacterized protein n=1 Tax=Aspergillus cristatus TaxID=573508 RepID=A0A1E3BLK9_ASPCR|nr:hypothetical protein SI65_02689 [Aspergillus cristatus]
MVFSYKLTVIYSCDRAYDIYEPVIYQLLETQYGMLGVTDIQPKITDASSHLIFTTIFCAPENIFLSDLQDVWLGEGIHTIVELLY